MALSADSEDTAIVTFVQSSGRKIKFEAKFLTRKQVKEHRRLRESLATTKDAEWDDVLKKMHDIGLVGWDLEAAYSFEALDDELSDQDVIDLVCGYPSGVQLTETEMGKSVSRRRFLVANSAATVPGDDATTSPPQSNPS